MGYRRSLLLGMVILVPLGYFVRFAGNTDWHSHGGAIAYTLFWICLGQFIRPRTSPLGTALGVFIATCAIELLQLWQPPWLQALRSTLPGRLVLGTTFLWEDFPPYVVGCFLGWLLIKWLRSQTSKSMP